MNNKVNNDKNLAKILALRENLKKRKTQQIQRKNATNKFNSEFLQIKKD